MNKISILIVNYNTDDLTIQAVDSVIKHVKEIQYEIIVVDNCSPKGTNLKNRIKKCPNTSFYQLDENIGFGRANNYGFKKSTGNYIFLLNSDAYLIEDCITPLITFLEKENKYACVTPDLLDSKGNKNVVYGNFLKKEKILNDLGIVKIERELLESEYATSLKCDFDVVKEVDYISGASMLIKRKVIDELGMFNPNFFMYYEDMDLCFKFKKHGYKNFVYPNVKMVHIGGNSWGNEVGNGFNSSKIIILSRYLFLKNIMNNGLALSMYIIMYVYELKRALLVSFKSVLLKSFRKKKS